MTASPLALYSTFYVPVFFPPQVLTEGGSAGSLVDPLPGQDSQAGPSGPTPAQVPGGGVTAQVGTGTLSLPSCIGHTRAHAHY